MQYGHNADRRCPLSGVGGSIRNLPQSISAPSKGFGWTESISCATSEAGAASSTEIIWSRVMAAYAQRTQSNTKDGSIASAALPDGATNTLALHWLQARSKVVPSTVNSASADAQTSTFCGSIFSAF